MIPPAPRRCGDQPTSLQERLEEALVYLFEINEHEPTQGCGRGSDDPARVRCSRCVARNVLLEAGWSLTLHEREVERFYGLLDGEEPPPARTGDA